MSRRPTVLTMAMTALMAIGCVTTVPAATPTTAPSVAPTVAPSPSPTSTPIPSATPEPTGTPAATPTEAPIATATSSVAPTASASESPTSGLVTGSGEDLCPTNEELPPGYDPFTTSQDNTARARDVVFAEAPAELDATNRLLAAWAAFAEISFAGTSVACGVYIFDASDIEDIYAWYADGFAGRSTFPLTELPIPTGSPGDDGRLFFHFTTSTNETESFTYLFRQHNVIASVSLDGPSADLGGPSSPDEVIALATTTSGRIEQNAAEGSSEGPFPSAGESELLGHVPDSFRETCGRATFAVSPDALDAVACSTEAGGGTITVTYQTFADLAAMQAAYGLTLDFLGIEPGTGPCSGEWPGEGGYTVGDEHAGQVGCGELGGVAPIISWTDERLMIHGYAEGFDISTSDLYQWWLSDSGPI